MPRSYNSATQASLNAGRIVDRKLILLDLGSGLYGFHTGLGPFVFNGVTYVGAGSLIDVGGVRQTSDLSSVQVVGRLTSIPNTTLTRDVLSTIEQEVYHQRPCTLMSAYFNPDTYSLLSVEIDYRGYIDRVVHGETVNGDAYLDFHLESKFRDHQKRGYRIRSDADQKLIDPFDSGFQHSTSVVSEKVLFGRVEQQAAPAAAYVPKKKSWIQRIFG